MIVKTADGFEERYSDAFKPYLKRVREVAMLTVFAATFVLFLLIVGGMSLGYVFKRKSLQGSCGGITALGWRKSATARNLAMRAKARSQSGTAARAAGQAPHSVAIAKTRLWPGFYLALPKGV